MAMQLESRGLISDAMQRADSERISYFTALCPLRSGTILAGFQVGPAKHGPDNTIGLCRSTDGGESWTAMPFRFESRLGGTPGSLAGGEMVEVAPGRVLLFATWFDRSDRERPLFDPVTEGILRSRQLMAVSTDEGSTWSPWRELPIPGLTGCAMCGPVTLWSDGTLAFAFESFKEFDDPKPARHAAWLLVSRDGGASFEPPFLVAQDPQHAVYYWDQRLCPTATSGEFVALFWTHDRAAQRDLRVHTLRASLHDRQPLPLPTETTIPGQIAAPLWLEDGRVFAFVVDRDQPGTLTLWQSSDGGATWPNDAKLVVHQQQELAKLSQGREHIDFAQYWEDMGKWTFGHPAMRRLSDDRLLLAFYAGSPDRMSIHWARVRV
jgi:hypothetical protein